MARPTDWNPLASSDPIPGDPGVVRQAAQNYADVAEAINTARDRLNAITFKGKSHHIDELRGKCEDLVVQIKQASSRCSGAAGALKTYAGALEGAQAKSLPILKEAKEAQGDQRRWKQEEWEQYYRHQRTTNPVERSFSLPGNSRGTRTVTSCPALGCCLHSTCALRPHIPWPS